MTREEAIIWLNQIKRRYIFGGEVDLRSKWKEYIGVPLSYAHLYGTEECMRDAYHREDGKE